MNMTQISACYTSLTIKQTTSAVRTSGDKTFEMLMSIGQKEKTAQAEKPETVELTAATGDGTYSGLSRFLTMMGDYRQWKSEQPDSALPQSLGSEGANLAWLREHFSGELDAFGVIDAVESMRSMGLLSREERNSIYGIEFTVVKVTELVSCMQILPAGYGSLWGNRFEDAPSMEFHSLQDLLDWLGRFRGQSSLSWELQCCELSARRLSVTYGEAEVELSSEAEKETTASV